MSMGGVSSSPPQEFRSTTIPFGLLVIPIRSGRRGPLVGTSVDLDLAVTDHEHHSTTVKRSRTSALGQSGTCRVRDPFSPDALAPFRSPHAR